MSGTPEIREPTTTAPEAETPRRSCNDCRFALMQDHGYSSWTVEGTHFVCLARRHPNDDSGVERDHGFDRFYGEDPRLTYGAICPAFVAGGPLGRDVDHDQLSLGDVTVGPGRYDEGDIKDIDAWLADREAAPRRAPQRVRHADPRMDAAADGAEDVTVNLSLAFPDVEIIPLIVKPIATFGRLDGYECHYEFRCPGCGGRATAEGRYNRDREPLSGSARCKYRRLRAGPAVSSPILDADSGCGWFRWQAPRSRDST